MEELWSCLPSLPSKGQGRVVLWLTLALTLLVTCGLGQHNTSTDHSYDSSIINTNLSDPSPSSTVWTTSSITTTTTPQQPSSTFGVTESQSEWTSATGDSNIIIISPSSPLLPQATATVLGGGSSESVLLSSPLSPESLLQSSTLIAPSVSVYSSPANQDTATPLAAADALSSSGDDETGWGVSDSTVTVTESSSSGVQSSVVQSTQHTSPFTAAPDSIPAEQSTAFLDSVATTIRRDPTQGPDLAQSSWLGSGNDDTRSSTSTAAAPSSPTFLPQSQRNDSSPASFFLEPTPTITLHSLSPTTPWLSGSESVFSHIDSVTVTQAVNSTLFSTLSPTSTTAAASTMEMNSTQISTSTTATGETTSFPSLMSSTTPDAVSSPAGGGGGGGGSGVNASCPEKDAGCVEYQGKDDGEEEELRMKVIVGAVCGAVLLLVMLVVMVGYLWKKRGKMPSGSKIDLSSYWDDSVTLSYINGHVDMPKDSTDEMISLDNDSFLNSLDSMSFTNTWTSDTSKHTNL